MIIKAMLVSILLFLVVSPANGQSLSDRLKHAREQERARELEREQNPDANPTSLRAMLGVLLYTNVDVNFEKTPVREVFTLLADGLDLTIIARYNDDRKAEGVGIDPDTPVTLSIKGASALTVLEFVLEQVGADDPATWQMRRGFVEVGTLDRLSSPGARVVRSYPVDELIYVPHEKSNASSRKAGGVLQRRPASRGGGAQGSNNPRTQPQNEPESDRAQELIDLIIQTVEPTAWEANGGDTATIRYSDGFLVVRAPDYIQRQIGGYPPPLRPTGNGATDQPTGTTP